MTTPTDDLLREARRARQLLQSIGLFAALQKDGRQAVLARLQTLDVAIKNCEAARISYEPLQVSEAGETDASLAGPHGHEVQRA